jgi:hypothetical protein
LFNVFVFFNIFLTSLITRELTLTYLYL